jgi:hypothetical protein
MILFVVTMDEEYFIPAVTLLEMHRIEGIVDNATLYC